jgi:hypothetical protein
MSDPTTIEAQLIHQKDIDHPNIFITEGKRRGRGFRAPNATDYLDIGDTPPLWAASRSAA